MNQILLPRFLKKHTTTGKWSNKQIMYLVILALLPGVAVQAYFLGYGNIIQILWASLLALVYEGIFLKLRNRTIKPILDGSGLLTAWLLAISIPGYAPWWILVIGIFFAIVVSKQLYGGLGHNIFNPAMVGYVVLLISFPVHMTTWASPSHSSLIHQLQIIDVIKVIFLEQPINTFIAYDAISQATTLDVFKQGLNTGKTFTDLLTEFSATLTLVPVLDLKAAKGWLPINMAFMLGGFLLIALKIIRWQIPFYFLLSLGTISYISHLTYPETVLSPTLHLLSGATMLGAFFILTDPVSASTTPRGQIIYALIVGFLVWLIRTFGGYPDAVAFAVLFANLCVPFIDHLTRTKPYGH
ncbi:electron transport complex subunit RsxD [Thorsellia kenyensis]|uniref:Ion-translocating oxidoreductase complex subunit D n=1 Tax=Thorsellia kenyensis TaxID=1549888 RepID=A0ABV6C8L6_9GAMM